MEIINSKEMENPLFKRKEVVLEVSSEIIPSYPEVKEFLSKKYSTTPEKIAIQRVKGVFGVKNSIIEAHLYNSVEDKDSVETMSKKEKEKDKMPEPKKEEPKEETLVEEKPTEEVKEEIPTEQKSEEVKQE